MLETLLSELSETPQVHCYFVIIIIITLNATVAVSFGMSNYSFSESDGSGLIDVTLNQDHNAPISVDIRSEDVTANG